MDLNEKEAIDFSWKIILRIDAYILSTINKSTSLAAFNTFLIAPIVLKVNQISFGNLVPWHLILLSLSLLPALTSLIFCISAIYPLLYKSSESKSVIFFDEIANYKDSKGNDNIEGYREEFESQINDLDKLYKSLSSEIYTISKIASKKHSRLKKAAWVTLVSLIFSVTFLIFVTK